MTCELHKERCPEMTNKNSNQALSLYTCIPRLTGILGNKEYHRRKMRVVRHKQSGVEAIPSIIQVVQEVETEQSVVVCGQL